MIVRDFFLYFCSMTTPQLHEMFLELSQVCTDTRKITEDCIFFALKGGNFNGNKFAAEALKKGATYAVVDESEYVVSKSCILVEDVLRTLQKLANYHRNYSKAKIIGLTGSNGKTTTKELVNIVLGKKYKTVATKGNLNNHIGVPLTLLSIKPDTEIAIVEMGANHQKEIEFLSSLAQPDFGYITNFGKAHLEGFGGEKGIIKGKSELYDNLMDNGKHIFINADDPVQIKKVSGYVKKIGFSTKNHEYYKIELLRANPFVKIKVEETIIESHLIGRYNFTNCGAAILIGKYFNVPLEDIKSAIESYTPQNNRSQLIEKNGHRIILDAYNANPSSMKAALENFQQLKGGPKIAFLGDMFELGQAARDEHQYIADLAKSMKFDTVFLIGKNFEKTDTSLLQFDSFKSLSKYFDSNSLKKSNILIKGSRGMALERVLEIL